MSDTHLFTPYVEDGTYPGDVMDDGRAMMQLSDADVAAWENARVADTAAVVTDVTTGTRWTVESAPCGAGCRCAAKATPADPAPQAATDWPAHDTAACRIAGEHRTYQRHPEADCPAVAVPSLPTWAADAAHKGHARAADAVDRRAMDVGEDHADNDPEARLAYAAGVRDALHWLTTGVASDDLADTLDDGTDEDEADHVRDYVPTAKARFDGDASGWETRPLILTPDGDTIHAAEFGPDDVPNAWGIYFHDATWENDPERTGGPTMWHADFGVESVADAVAELLNAQGYNPNA